MNNQYHIANLILGLAISLPINAQQVVKTETVLSERLQQHDRVIGSVKASSEANLAVRESGYVAQVFVKEGARVKAGQLLLKLDDRRLKSELAQAQAEVNQAKALLKQRQAELLNAQADVTAYTYSAKKQAISQRQLRLAETERNVVQAAIGEAEALIAAKKAQVQLLKVRLADLSLTAPFAGVVTERFAEQGEWFNQGQTAISLVEDAHLEAWLEVPERFANTLTFNNTEKITLQVNGMITHAHSQATIRKVDNRARTFTLVARFDNSQHHWMIGMSVLAWLPVGQQQEVLTVSKNALVQRNRRYKVFQVTSTEKGQMAIPIPVDILFYQGTRVAIAAPQLAAGHQVVIEGNERLMQGPVVTAHHESEPKHTSSETINVAQSYEDN